MPLDQSAAFGSVPATTVMPTFSRFTGVRTAAEAWPALTPWRGQFKGGRRRESGPQAMRDPDPSSPLVANAGAAAPLAVGADGHAGADEPLVGRAGFVLQAEAPLILEH